MSIKFVTFSRSMRCSMSHAKHRVCGGRMHPCFSIKYSTRDKIKRIQEKLGIKWFGMAIDHIVEAYQEPTEEVTR